MLEQAGSLSLEQREFALEEVSSASPLLESETANQLTHALGFLLSLAATGVMLKTVFAHADWPRMIGCGVYLSSLVALYAASTLSHSFDDPSRRAFFRTLDQVCIFLLVAGSFTPFGLMHMRDGLGEFILASMWALVAIGIWKRVTKGDGAVSFAYFALIGWLPVMALGHVFDVAGLTGLALVCGGGLAYTGGLWFLTNDHRHHYLHATWHLCTIAGSLCHFLFLQWYVAEWPIA